MTSPTPPPSAAADHAASNPAVSDERVRELRVCSICKGRAIVEQIDSSIGVLTGVQCADIGCNGHWNNAWFENTAFAAVWWNDQQKGRSAMNYVLPFINRDPRGGE